MARDKVLDGFRAVAVSSVVYAHATAYRFADVPWLHYPQRLSDPLAELGVQMFFVISGFIITSLLLREEAKDDRVSIPAFYARRIFRIVPPFAVFLLFVPVDGIEKAKAAAFTCNIFQCDWGAAHSWSLAVEEQFYLFWPLLFVMLGRHRTPFLIATILALTAVFILRPPTFHSNAASFSHIAIGALFAVEPSWRVKGRYGPWLVASLALVLGPITPLAKLVGVINPLLIAYLIFGAYDLPLVRGILGSRPFQWVGAVSYSLYLWQQPFLGKESNWPLWLLPVAVIASRRMIELPLGDVGHRLSARLKASGRSNPSINPKNSTMETAEALANEARPD